MAAPRYWIGLFLSLALAAGSMVDGWYATSPLSRRGSGSAIQILMGDSRKILSGFLISKADSYFHRGFYPSIFDQQAKEDDNHLAEAVSGHHEHHENETPEEHAKHSAPSAPTTTPSKTGSENFLARFGKNFQPGHAHMNGRGGEERELLPWLKLAIEMDPHRVEFYPVAAFWLRTQLTNVAEAESLLRSGLRENPNHYLLLTELGNLYLDDRKRPDQARFLLVAALKQWQTFEESKTLPDVGTHQRILVSLIRLEKEQKQYAKALEYARLYQKFSPNPHATEAVIKEIEAAWRR